MRSGVARFKRTSVYRMLRALRYAWDPPGWYTQEQNEVNFYRQFIHSGSLCFDIGANVGTKTRMFRLLGARVVAVEPGAAAAEQFAAGFDRDTEVVLVRKAIGSANGFATLHIGDNSTTSTLSESWQVRAKATQRLRGRQWVATVQVAVTTLDDLIGEYGLPDFCKIDVEGFEVDVLRGLSQPLPALSFEFQPETLQATSDAVDRLSALGGYRYNYSLASPLKLELSAWTDAAGIKTALATAFPPGIEVWGDVYATTD